MAELTAFHYRTGNTMVHALDTRFKLVLLALASLTILNASVRTLAFASGAMVLLCLSSRIHLWSAARELRYFFVLLAMVFTARVLSTPGEPLVQIGFLVIGKNGLIEGAIVCWRFLLVIILGLVFISTTRVSLIKRSVAWILSPIPGVPEKRVATMLGLVVRFIPVIFTKAKEVTAAQHARCIGCRKNPFYRLKIFTIPLLRSVFRDAGNLAMAMEARCYSEHGVIHVDAASRRDWIILIAGTSLCVVVLFG